jgi:hypothetical protein
LGSAKRYGLADGTKNIEGAMMRSVLICLLLVMGVAFTSERSLAQGIIPIPGFYMPEPEPQPDRILPEPGISGPTNPDEPVVEEQQSLLTDELVVLKDHPYKGALPNSIALAFEGCDPYDEQLYWALVVNSVIKGRSHDLSLQHMSSEPGLPTLGSISAQGGYAQISISGSLGSFVILPEKRILKYSKDHISQDIAVDTVIQGFNHFLLYLPLGYVELFSKEEIDTMVASGAAMSKISTLNDHDGPSYSGGTSNFRHAVPEEAANADLVVGASTKIITSPALCSTPAPRSLLLQ